MMPSVEWETLKIYLILFDVKRCGSNYN